MKEGGPNCSFNLTAQNYWNNVEHMKKGGSSEESIKRCLNFFVQTFSTQTGSSSGTSEHATHGRVYILSAQTVRSLAGTQAKQFLIIYFYIRKSASCTTN